MSLSLNATMQKYVVQALACHRTSLPPDTLKREQRTR